ncbi:MAG: glycosyltransferase family 2 protein [Mariprofundaceae bacterium]|nr:glycosyltransferase family 2 protein [Mariprofundaceae bacterium]
MKLSVIIPAFNEAERLPSTLEEAYGWLTEQLADDFEMIVVDDGSSDETVAKTREMIASHPHLKILAQPQNYGKGAAVKRGMLEAGGDIRLFMDADHSTHIREAAKVMTAMERGSDVIIASRQHPESDISVSQSWLREHMGKSFNFIMRSIVGLKMEDTQCGFKAFTATAAEDIFSRQKLEGFSFDVELLFLASRLGYRIAEIPVEWINEPNSRVRMIADPVLMFADVVRIRRLHREL